ncbi:Rpn family recombination-promoting nuclease/putative transposase [Serratia proteamaculans]
MKKKPTPVPHDAAFEAFLTHPDTARDFIERHLPPICPPPAWCHLGGPLGKRKISYARPVS